MKKNHFLFRYLMIFIVIGVCIAIASYKYHKDFEKHFRTDIENQLSLIADLKVGELEDWLEERRGDAETVFGNEAFARYVKSYLKNPNDKATERDIKVWIEEFQAGFNYDAVKLIDIQLVKRIIIPEVVEQNLVYMVPGNLDSLKAGKLVFEDFYYNELKKKIFLKILIPILNEHQLIAIIELRIDPKHNLYPILTNWPVPSVSSETIILRREGNEAVYLSELRFQKNAMLNVRIPLNDTTITAVRAILGHKGFMVGKAYSGNEVVAFAKKVPNSPWFLVAQTEANEIYAPLRRAFWQTMIFAFGIFLIAGFGLGFVWRYQRSLSYKDQIISAEALRVSEERFRSLFENSAMGIYRTTPDGNILLANNTLVKMLGFSDFEDLCSIELDKEGYEPNYDRKEFIDQIEKNGEIIGLEAEWTRKDGTPIYIRESARAIRNSNQKTLFYDGTVEDITELKKVELERMVIYEIIEGIATIDNLTELLKLTHQSLRKVLYADNYFVALHDQNTGLFSFPYYEDMFDSTPEPLEMLKSCTAYVFRTGKPLLITPELFKQLKEQNDVELVGLPSPSWIGVPLKTPTRTIGVLVLQHYEKENVYSERHVQFLDSIGSQIAMAVERRQAEEDLRNERLLLRTVIDNIPDSIYCKDIACRKTLANHTELSYSGANSEADILGKTDFDLYPKELAEGFFADDQLVLQTGKPVLNREEYLIDQNGQKRWLLTSKLPLKDANGKILGIVGIGRDITDRKHTEDDLRESEVKLNVILQSTADGILAVDSTGKVIKTNNRFVELWRIPQAIIDSGDDNALIGFVLDQLTNPDEFISKVQKLYHSTDEDLDFLHFKDGRTFERYSAPMVMADDSIGRVWSFRDITERKRAEEALIESEEQFRTVLESVSLVGLILDHDGRITLCNDYLLGLTGWNREDVLQRNWFETFLPPEILKDIQTDIFHKSILNEQIVEHYENEIMTRQGERRLIAWNNTLLHDHLGAVSGIASIGEDITERKQAEEALKESEKKFRLLIENQGEGLTIVDPDENVLFVNPAAESIFGVEPGMLAGQNLKNFVVPNQFDQVRNETGKREKNEKSSYEVDIITPSGIRRNILVTATPQSDENGKFIGTFGVIRDITERKKAETAVFESEVKYRTLVETMSDGVYRSTPDGKFVEVNPALVRILGYDSKEELMAIDIKSDLYFSIEERESADLEEKLVEKAIFRLRKKDGTGIWVEDHGRHVLDENGQILYHEGSLRDISDRVLAEQEIKLKNEELQKINSEKDKFFSIIAHDLRTPFNGFLGLTQIMAEELPSLTMAEIQDLAISMKNSATNLYRLLENLLQWSQLQKGAIPSNPEVYQLHSIASESITMIMEPARNKGIEITYDITDDLKVFADSNMLQTVIRNLVSNAIKFTPKGGNVSVSAKTAGNNSIEISVCDSGIGMSQDRIDNLFRPDVQTSRKGTDGEPSTGLGLLLCKEFVEKHGGHIWVESEEGGGSVFRFSLPYTV